MMWTAQVNERPQNWIATLRRFVREPALEPEHCELCNGRLSAEHSHLIEPATRSLKCACEPCAILFANPADGHYRRVPRRFSPLPHFQITDPQWDALALPIGMAFFFYSTPDKRIVALYPGPAGATESQLRLDAWEDLVAANPVLSEFEPDVEALLVNRIDGAREYYRAPIDRCYTLVGLIRKHWRGLSGGAEARAVIDDFFIALREPIAAPGGRLHA